MYTETICFQSTLLVIKFLFSCYLDSLVYSIHVLSLLKAFSPLCLKGWCERNIYSSATSIEHKIEYKTYSDRLKENLHHKIMTYDRTLNVLSDPKAKKKPFV